LDIIFGSGVWCNNWQQHRAGERGEISKRRIPVDFEKEGELQSDTEKTKLKQKRDDLELVK